ncbi:hypothetical protein LCGC14_0909800 [marine sediment metagenome]
MAIAIATLVSCKKDELEEAVLKPTAQQEQNSSGSIGQENTNGAGGTVGTNAENGEDGFDGSDGENGEDGAQGEPGTDGQDGTDGEDGADGAQGEQGEAGPAGENGAQGPKGDQGDTGPAGPKGDTGAPGIDGINGTNGIDGADGVDGVDGVDGEDGNANVIASDWFEPKESSFSVNNPQYKALPLDTSIKSKIADGVLLVYYDDDIQVQLLPRYTYESSGKIVKSVDSHVNHASNTLYIIIQKFGFDLNPTEYLWNPSGPAYAKGIRFRYIVIPNGTTSKNSFSHFEKMSYNEVIEYFGLAR